MLPVFQYAHPDGTEREMLSRHWRAGHGENDAHDAGQPLAGAGRLTWVMTRFLWRRRYGRHLRRAYRQKVRAGYSVSDADYARMERQARAYADGNGAH